MTDETVKRTLPQNDLDFNMMVTDTLWGSPFVSNDLKDTLTKEFYLQNEDGQQVTDKEGRVLVKKEALWGLMSYYTRDLRLANLSNVQGEMYYCRYYLDLAGDLLKSDMFKAFMVSLSRVATVLELSQSKGGFLRKNMNTLTTEEKHQMLNPPKKKLMGKGDSQ